jgi:hypothetical protein
MTNSTTFWVVLAVAIFPMLLVVGMFCALMIGVNLVLLPAWTLVAMGYVGTFSNEISRCWNLHHPAPSRHARDSLSMRHAHA